VCGLESRRISWSEGRSWRLAGGQLLHQTSGFFSLSGVRAESNVPELEGLEQPIIVQPEVGILGLLVRLTQNGPQLLMQAKAEPGNDLEHFLPRFPSGAVADSLQSEQGSRFLNKYNRNITVLVIGSGPEPVSELWRWVNVTGFLELMNTDFCVNTDARSALVSSDWALLSEDGRPFERWRGSGGFGESLLDSVSIDHRGAEGNSLGVFLERMRNGAVLKVSLKPLEELDGWRLGDNGISDRDHAQFEVPMHRVSTGGREIGGWDQPLIRNYGELLAVLLCQRREGVLRFQLRGSAEIGFGERVQFGPSTQEYSLGGVSPLPEGREAILRAESRQSDEGGRFDRSLGTYRIVELAEGVQVEDGPDTCWATLKQIYEAVRAPGLLNNELRSTLSLLLPYL
jgi:oxidase EvaA